MFCLVSTGNYLERTGWWGVGVNVPSPEGHSSTFRLRPRANAEWFRRGRTSLPPEDLDAFEMETDTYAS
jgi:hypothetical protein